LLDLGESAIKMTAEGQHIDDAGWVRILLEGQLLRLVAAECPEALQFYGSWIESMAFKKPTAYRCFLRTELCGSSLAALKRSGHTFTEAMLRCILNQVCSGQIPEEDASSECGGSRSM
jgi:hypothetical protein